MHFHLNITVICVCGFIFFLKGVHGKFVVGMSSIMPLSNCSMGQIYKGPNKEIDGLSYQWLEYSS